MQNIYIEDAIYLATIIEKYFKNKVSLITPKIEKNNNYPYYSVSFVLYRTYHFIYEYERGYYSIRSGNTDKKGIFIQFSDENRKKINNKDFDETIVKNNLRILDSEIRLRLPDKFLVEFD